MCLLFLSYDNHPHYGLVVAANRDEFYERPAEKACFWDESPGILAGRDLRAGGTWLGITRQGRIAAITNYRDPASVDPLAPSRGTLVSDFLRKGDAPEEYLDRLIKDGQRYNGFNLIFGRIDQLYWYCNRESSPRKLEKGDYGLSNHLLDTPWPKVKRIKKGMKDLMQKAKDLPVEDILALLQDPQTADDNCLPHTNVGLEKERMLSPIFIASPDYGTRSSTVILIDRTGHVIFVEKTYDAPARPSRMVEYIFNISS